MGGENSEPQNLSTPTLHRAIYMLGSSLQIVVKLLVITLIFFYICKFSGSPNARLLVNFIMGRGKGTKKRHSTHSYFDSWFSTGDFAKDIVTQKNTIMNAKI